MKNDTTWSAEDFKIIRSFFDHAVALPSSDREEFLDKNCHREEVKKYVAALLRSHNEGGVLEESMGAGQTLTLDSYRLLRPIGEGGMGVVFIAERCDGSYEKKVAIKMLSIQGGADGHRRFLEERQILAELEHPNIARLLDGGTAPDGTPYLVMEYVDGKPIDEYCRDRSLTLKERIRIFCEVCAAVQFAHQNSIAHRDIKPSNILVTQEGIPKLLDFGIAKLLSPEPLPDETREIQLEEKPQPMTLAYACPEQVENRNVTPTSDVYALGAVLFELLVGNQLVKTRDRSVVDVVSEICYAATPVPSQEAQDPKLRRRLTGDLDSIVLRALQKDPKDRYGSAESLSQDLQNYLSSRPVEARHGNLFYQANKFANRNRLAVGTLAFLFISILFFALIVQSQNKALAAERDRVAAERDRVAAERDRADDAIEFLTRTFEFVDPFARDRPLGGTNVLASDVLEMAAAWLDGGAFEHDIGTEVRLRTTLGTAFEGIADFANARNQLERAVKLSKQQLGEKDLKYADALFHLARLTYTEGRPRDFESSIHGQVGAVALEWLAEAETVQREAGGKDELAETFLLQAAINLGEDDVEGAEAALDEIPELVGEEEFDHRRIRAARLHVLGGVRREQGAYPEARVVLLEALRQREILFGAKSSHAATTDAHPTIVGTLNELGMVHASLLQFEAAEDYYKTAYEMIKEALGEEHYLTGVGANNVATAFQSQAQQIRDNPTEKGLHLKSARRFYQLALRAAERQLNPDHRQIASTKFNIGVLYLDFGRLASETAASETEQQENYEDSQKYLLESIEAYRLNHERPHSDLAWAWVHLGIANEMLGQSTDAERSFSQALQIYRQMKEPPPGDLAFATGRFARFYQRVKGSPTEACPLAEESLLLMESLLEEMIQGIPEEQRDLAFGGFRAQIEKSRVFLEECREALRSLPDG